MLITFKTNVCEADIDNLQRAYSAIEVSQLPKTDIRVWEIPSFPVHFKYNSQEKVLIDINTVNQSAMQQAEVEGVDLDYSMELYNSNYDNGDTQNLGSSFDCNTTYSINHESGNYPTRLSLIDTGFSPNEIDDGGNLFFDLGTISGYNYVDDNANFIDDNGHGTHIASIINHVSHSASELEPHNSFTDYNILKSFNQNGNAYISDVLKAIDKSIAEGVHILNFSFSYRAAVPDKRNKTPVQRAIEKAEAANILIVTAAGNDFGIDNDHASIKSYPASYDYPNILTVASVNCNGGLSQFSNYGYSTIDVAAPGEYIEGASPHDKIVNLSGTSQSTAIVTGIANMLASHLSEFNYEKIKCAILSGTEFSPDLLGKVFTGGIVNANNAFAILDKCVIDELPFAGTIPLASIRNKKITTVEIYPNPVKEFIRINTRLFMNEDFEYSFFDLSGKEILHGARFGEKGPFSIDINIPKSIDSGFYFFNYKTSTSKGFKKIVVQR